MKPDPTGPPTQADLAVRKAAVEAARGRAEAIERLIRLSKTPRPEASPPRTTRDAHGDRNWTRDDLYDR